MKTSAHVADATWFITRAKIEPCPRTEPHSHSYCPFLHPEEGVPRRDPFIHQYDSILCYDLHNNKVCKRGLNCPYSHNLFEYNLHPARFRTRMCEYGDKCRRELCFFAHSDSQMRARTSVKNCSGGRRSGRRHRAAAALRSALAGSPHGDLAGGGSNCLSFLQVPSPPGAAVSSGSNDGLMQLDLATQEALARLSAASTHAAGVAPVTLAQEQAQTSPVLILQDGASASSSAYMLPTMCSDIAAYAAGSMPLSTGTLYAGSSMVGTQGLGLSSAPAGSMQRLSAVADIRTHSMPQSASVLPVACNAPGAGLAAASHSSTWPAGLTSQQQQLLVGEQQLLPLSTQQTPIPSAQVQMQLMGSSESLDVPLANSAAINLGMVSTTAAAQAVSNNVAPMSVFAPVSAANLVSYISMNGTAVLQAQQLSMQLAAAGTPSLGLPSAAAAAAAAAARPCAVLPNYMQE